MQPESKIKVWDPLVRVFHWGLVSAFTVAYITEEDFLTLHAWAGYIVLGLLLVRILWGFIGTRHARFSDFVTSPRESVRYAIDAVQFQAKRYIGHNPAGALMILIMLISLILTGVTGIAVYGAGENAGPMAGLFAGNAEFWEDVFEEVHEFFANFTVLLVIVHIAGVIVESVAHRENLVKAMISGFKRSEKAGGGHA